MRFSCLVAASLIISAAFGCSGSKTEESVSLDAGQPTRPLFFDFEGLRWGMTPQEVIAVWGTPAKEGLPNDLLYADKGGYKEARLIFLQSVDSSLTILSRVFLSPGTDNIKPKTKVRTELLASCGEPLTDPKVHASQSCEKCEIFRAAECTVAVALWAPAVPELKWPDRLDALTYALAPHSLVREIPREKWSQLRGSVPSSPSAEIKSRYKSFVEGATGNGASVAEIVRLVGPPNFYFEESKGKGTLYYFRLTGSYHKLEVEEGTLRGSSYAYYHE